MCSGGFCSNPLILLNVDVAVAYMFVMAQELGPQFLNRASSPRTFAEAVVLEHVCVPDGVHHRGRNIV